MANLNQIINAVAYQGNSSFADLIEDALNDPTPHTIYIDQLTGTATGTGSFVRPCKDLDGALPLLKEGIRMVIAPGSYSVPINLTGLTSFIAMGDRTARLNTRTELSGQLELGSSSKDCYFGNIAFKANTAIGQAGQPIITINGFKGEAIFENCEFQSADGNPVLTCQIGGPCRILFKDCIFNRNSTVIQTGRGNGTVISLINTIAPQVELLQDGYIIEIDGCDCGKCKHTNGHLAIKNSTFSNLQDGDACITSTATNVASASILLYNINTQNGTQGEAFGKISKTGDCQGWYYGITKPTTFEHDLGDLKNINDTNQAVTSAVSANITASPVGTKGDKNGIEISGSNGSFGISLLPADETNPGIITQENQTFGGEKEFKGGIKIPNINLGNITNDPVPLSINKDGQIVSGQKELVESGTTFYTGMTMRGKAIRGFFASVATPKSGETSLTTEVLPTEVQFIEIKGIVNIADTTNPFATRVTTKTIEEARSEGLSFVAQSSASGALVTITNGSTNKLYDNAILTFTVSYIEK